jgi:hypothetical protein
MMFVLAKVIVVLVMIFRVFVWVAAINFFQFSWLTLVIDLAIVIWWVLHFCPYTTESVPMCRNVFAFKSTEAFSFRFR